MGGEGSLELASATDMPISQVIAAAPEHSPALKHLGYSNLARQSVRLVHGERDAIVPLRNSIEIADELRSIGGIVTLEILQGNDHFIAEQVFSIAEFQGRLDGPCL
jgi:predicted esterase